MKHNVINSQYTVDHYTGSLSIIGVSTDCRSSIVFRLVGDYVSDLMIGTPDFCKNAIFAKDVESGLNMLIFEYNLRGELRNPRKLLKSVRNKLVQASFRNLREDYREFNEMYSMTDRQEHDMFSRVG